MALDCFDTIVGLSKVSFDCFTDEAPDGFDTSDSGFYLTDTDYGLTIAQQCRLDGWTMLQDALTQAIQETKSDLRAMLRQEFESAVTPFKGLIGKLQSSASLNSATKDVIGVRIRTRRQQKGVKLVIKKVYLGVNTSADFTLYVASNDPLFESPSPGTVTTVANNTTASVAAIDNLELPLWSESAQEDYLEYFIYTERSGAQPLNNTFRCCGNTPGWAQHLEVSGMNADDGAGTNGQFSSTIAFGFVLDAYLACEELDWICDLQELNGYYLRDVIARTVQARGAAIAISALIDTIQVNPCTGYQAESLNARRTYLNKRYADNLAWIVANVPNGVTNCFNCKQEKTFTRSKLLV